MNRIALFAFATGLTVLAFVGLTLILTLGLALAAVAITALAARRLIGTFRCTSSENTERQHGLIQRIWNDGKGTIIDM